MEDSKNEKEMIKKLNILSKEGKSIFDEDCKYIIPRYQRAYAWEDQEIIQLIDDIKDIEDKASSYYIGSLIVAKNSEKNEYEVVDGQQRLTTLFLLLNYLGAYKDNNKQQNLSFAYRDKSNYTLEKIKYILLEIIKDNKKEKYENLDHERIEQSIYKGLIIINEAFIKYKIDIDNFIEKLTKVILFRIEVPEHTDLNRYFETMNTRGEQLDQVDILKSRLMATLKNNTDKNWQLKARQLFAKIWDACSDMSDYVQMGFTTNERSQIFGENWKDLPYKNLGDLIDSINSRPIENQNCTVINLIKEKEYLTNSADSDNSADTVGSKNLDDTNKLKQKENSARYESIVDFPHFLLHTLRVYEAIKYKVNSSTNMQESSSLTLDDKKLLTFFKEVSEKENNFAEKFIIFLLQTRYLFDCYIIKREKANDNDDGKWILKYFENKKTRKQNNIRYTNTEMNDAHDECLMIEAALRVSYTSPKSMSWLTEALIWIYNKIIWKEVKDKWWQDIEGNLIKYLENFAANQIKYFVNEGKYNLGVETPHIVFNVLDYILWKEKPKKDKVNDFNFEFRNSVEHFYPQHPSEGSITKWENSEDPDNCVDMFGNLCIVSRKVNSKFSNLSPTSKCRDYGNTISGGSLKLRLMADLAIAYNREQEEKGKIPYDQEYLNGYITMCQEHQEDMERKLNDFINETLS